MSTWYDPLMNCGCKNIKVIRAVQFYFAELEEKFNGIYEVNAL